MTLPRRIELRDEGEQLALAQSPVETLDVVRGEPRELRGDAAAVASALTDVATTAVAWELELRPPAEALTVEVLLRANAQTFAALRLYADPLRLVFERPEASNAEVASDFPGSFVAPLPADVRDPRLHVIGDRNSVEVFTAGGRVAFTALVFPLAPLNEVDVLVADGAELEATVWPLRSAWH